ncbi:MAG: hypothetical protein KAS75_01885 [Planctomycetes bacterium]|nr:hypothetical protein [Planctomycetota bacterium]
MKDKNKILIISATILIVGSGSLAMLAKNRKGAIPKINIEEPNQIAEYFQSDEFRNLDPNARRVTARSVIRQIMTDSAEKYAQLPTEERIAYLDKVIDSMEGRRQEGRSREDRSDRRRRWRNRKPEDMRERRESIDPETREKMSAFRRALRQRWRERRGN